MTEAKIWEGRPSSQLMLQHWILAAITFGLWLPIALLKYYELRSTEYSLSTQRLFIKHGVFARVEDEVELYRVKDTRLDQPFGLRLFGLANIVLITTDANQPNIVLQALANAKEVREKLRNATEHRRDQKGVREVQLA
jgi:membrane protein YdbS with pleckstrin-like domain